MTRKTRSDKKREVKPTISAYIKRNLFTLAKIVDLPLKDVALIMIGDGLFDDRVLKEFQPLMVSNFCIGNTTYIGNRENHPISIKYRGGKEKISIRFPSIVYENLRNLSFAIGAPPTTTASLMLRKAMFNSSFMESHVIEYSRHIENVQRVDELKRFIEYLPNTIPKEDS